MGYNSEFFLYKKLSTAFCLALIFLLSSIVGAYCLWQSSKIQELQKPFNPYASIEEVNASSSVE